jgi:hypothetical protein
VRLLHGIPPKRGRREWHQRANSSSADAAIVARAAEAGQFPTWGAVWDRFGKSDQGQGEDPGRGVAPGGASCRLIRYPFSEGGSRARDTWVNRLTESRKADRDHSRSVKTGTGRPVKPPPGQTLAAWSTLHCVKSNPGWSQPDPPSHWLLRRHPKTAYTRGVVQGSRVEHRTMRPGVGMSGRPKPRSSTVSGNTRSTVGGRPPRRRSPRSSPRAGKPPTWRRGAGCSMSSLRGTRDAKCRSSAGHHQ